MRGQRFVVAATLVGLAVLTVVLVLSSFATIHSAQLISFRGGGDARKIVVNIVTGLGTEIAERTVHENAQTDTVTVNMRQSPGTYPAIAFYLPVVVSLKDALGDRRVLDASGNTVRDLGMYIAPGTTPQP